MPQSDARDDPFLAFRYVISFGPLRAGFSECTGLQVELEVKDYMEGGMNSYVHKFPGRSKQGNLTLKRGIVDTALWDWYYDLMQGRVIFRDGSISVKDPSGGQTVMAWQLTRAFPIKWVGPDLNADQNNIAVETLELAFHDLKRET
jgi:phage tail-like protein